VHEGENDFTIAFGSCNTQIQKIFYGNKLLKINQIYGFGAVIIFMLTRKI